MPRLLVFGARGLGRTIAEHLIPQGWDAVGVARSQDTAGGVSRSRASSPI